MTDKLVKLLADDACEYNLAQESKPLKGRLLMTGIGETIFKQYLGKQREKDDGTGIYAITVAFDKKAAFIKQIQGVAKELAAEVFGKARKLKFGMKNGDDYVNALIEDADNEVEAEELKEKLSYMLGKCYINFSSKYDLNENEKEPGIVDPARGMVDAEKVKGGSKVVIILSPYSYDNKGNKGIAYGLRGVQLFEFGTRGGGGNSASLFKERGTSLAEPDEEEETEETEEPAAPAKKKAKAKPKAKAAEEVAEEVEEVEEEESAEPAETDAPSESAEDSEEDDDGPIWD